MGDRFQTDTYGVLDSQPNISRGPMTTAPGETERESIERELRRTAGERALEPEQQ